MSQEAVKPIDLAILMPVISDWERTKIRYGGLAEQLLMRGVEVALVESHSSYRGDGNFDGAKIPINPTLGSMDGFSAGGTIKPRVVRDLTMPTGPKQLYIDSGATLLVHDPTINELLVSKSRVYDIMSELQPFSIGNVQPNEIEEAITEIPGQRVVIKPDTGSGGEGVLLGDKRDVLAAFKAQDNPMISIVQEAIDMTRGLPEHGASGVHNVRFIAIAGTAIFGFVRSDSTGSPTMQGETFENRNFLPPDGFRQSLRDVLLKGQEIFNTLPRSHETVLAYDLIRGLNHEGEEREYILEINRRPLRNSPFDGSDSGTLWASHQWDAAEAAMLEACVWKQP